MAEIQLTAERQSHKGGLWAGAAISLALFVIGAAGGLSLAAGYALLLVSALLLLGSVVLFSVFLLSRKFDGAALKRGFTWLFIAGAVLYVFGCFALGGYFFAEALQGRLALRWIIFGPVVMAAVVVLDAGIYRLLVEKNLPTYERYRRFISREASDPVAMRQTLVDEVVLQKSLFSLSRFRWIKHTLIFWGFILLFVTEMFAVLFREILASFGMEHLWAPDHPLRLLFDIAFEVFGLAVLAGCVLALVWRVMVNGTELQKYTDTPTALFLFIVVLSGFFVEALRIAAAPPDPLLAVSFVGYVMAMPIGDPERWYGAFYEPLWYIHVIGSCLFIAYIPVKRLIHSCATPMGRLMNSQTRLLQAKRMGVIAGLFQGREERAGCRITRP